MALHFSEGNDEWIAVDASNHAMKAMASDGDKTFMLMVQALAGSAYFPDGDLIVSPRPAVAHALMAPSPARC